MFVSSYTYAKNPVKRVKSGVYYGEANDLMTEKDDHPHVNQESVSNETKESAGDETQQNPPHTTIPTATVQIDPNRLWVRRDEYKRFASYFRSKYIVTSYALYLSRHQPSLKTVICDPGVAATNIAREWEGGGDGERRDAEELSEEGTDSADSRRERTRGYS